MLGRSFRDVAAEKSSGEGVLQYDNPRRPQLGSPTDGTAKGVARSHVITFQPIVATVQQPQSHVNSFGGANAARPSEELFGFFHGGFPDGDDDDIALLPPPLEGVMFVGSRVSADQPPTTSATGSPPPASQQPHDSAESSLNQSIAGLVSSSSANPMLFSKNSSENMQKDELDRALSQLIDHSQRRSRRIKEEILLKQMTDDRAAQHTTAEDIYEELDPEDVAREEKRNFAESIARHQCLGPGEIRRCLMGDDGDDGVEDPWSATRARAVKDAVRMVRKHVVSKRINPSQPLFGNAHRPLPSLPGELSSSTPESSTSGGNHRLDGNRSPFLSDIPVFLGEPVVDEDSGTLIQVWRSRAAGRDYIRMLRALSHARHMLLLPSLVAVPFAVSVVWSGYFVTVTWLPPLLHKLNASVTPSAQAAKTFPQAVSNWMATLFHLRGTSNVSPWEMYSASDDRFYLIPTVHMMRYRAKCVSRLPESSAFVRFEYMQIDPLETFIPASSSLSNNGDEDKKKMRSDNGIPPAIELRLIPLLKKHVGGLVKLAKSDVNWLSRLFHACGVGIKHILVVRQCLQSDLLKNGCGGSSQAKLFEALDALIVTEVLARAMKTLILRQANKKEASFSGSSANREGNTSLSTTPRLPLMENHSFITAAAKPGTTTTLVVGSPFSLTPSQPDKQMCSPSSSFAGPNAFVATANQMFRKMLTNKKFLSGIVFSHVFRKYDEAATFEVNLDAVVLPVLIRHLETKLGLRFSPEDKLFKEEEDSQTAVVNVLQHSGREPMDVASVVKDEALLAETVTLRVQQEGDPDEGAASAVTLLSLYYALVAYQNGMTGAENIFRGAISRAATHSRQLAKQHETKSSRDYLLFTLTTGKLIDNHSLIWKCMQSLCHLGHPPRSDKANGDSVVATYVTLPMEDGLFLHSILLSSLAYIEEEGEAAAQAAATGVSRLDMLFGAVAQWTRVISASGAWHPTALQSASGEVQHSTLLPLDVKEFFSEESMCAFVVALGKPYGALVRQHPSLKEVTQHAMLLIAWCSVPITAAQLILRNFVLHRMETFPKLHTHNGTLSEKLAVERLILRLAIAMPNTWEWFVTALTMMPVYRREFTSDQAGRLLLRGAAKSRPPPEEPLPSPQDAEMPLLASLSTILQREDSVAFEEEPSSWDAVVVSSGESVVRLSQVLARLSASCDSCMALDRMSSSSAAATATPETILLLLPNALHANAYISYILHWYLKSAMDRVTMRNVETSQREACAVAEEDQRRTLQKSRDEQTTETLKKQRELEQRRAEKEAAAEAIRRKRFEAAAKKLDTEETTARIVLTNESEKLLANLLIECKAQSEKVAYLEMRRREDTLQAIRDNQTRRKREAGEKLAAQLVKTKVAAVQVKREVLERHLAEEAAEQESRSQALAVIQDRIEQRRRVAAEARVAQVMHRLAEEMVSTRSQREAEMAAREAMIAEEKKREEALAALKAKHDDRIKKQGDDLAKKFVLEKALAAHQGSYYEQYPNIRINRNGSSELSGMHVTSSARNAVASIVTVGVKQLEEAKFNISAAKSVFDVDAQQKVLHIHSACRQQSTTHHHDESRMAIHDINDSVLPATTYFQCSRFATEAPLPPRVFTVAVDLETAMESVPSSSTVTSVLLSLYSRHEPSSLTSGGELLNANSGGTINVNTAAVVSRAKLHAVSKILQTSGCNSSSSSSPNSRSATQIVAVDAATAAARLDELTRLLDPSDGAAKATSRNPDLFLQSPLLKPVAAAAVPPTTMMGALPPLKDGGAAVSTTTSSKRQQDGLAKLAPVPPLTGLKKKEDVPSVAPGVRIESLLSAIRRLRLQREQLPVVVSGNSTKSQSMTEELTRVLNNLGQLYYDKTIFSSVASGQEREELKIRRDVACFEGKREQVFHLLKPATLAVARQAAEEMLHAALRSRLYHRIPYCLLAHATVLGCGNDVSKAIVAAMMAFEFGAIYCASCVAEAKKKKSSSPDGDAEWLLHVLDSSLDPSQTNSMIRPADDSLLALCRIVADAADRGFPPFSAQTQILEAHCRGGEADCDAYFAHWSAIIEGFAMLCKSSREDGGDRDPQQVAHCSWVGALIHEALLSTALLLEASQAFIAAHALRKRHHSFLVDCYGSKHRWAITAYDAMKSKKMRELALVEELSRKRVNQ